METVKIGGVPVSIYPAAHLQGRWCVSPEGRDFGALITIVNKIVGGAHAGLLDAIASRQSIHEQGLALDHSDGAAAKLDRCLKWSSFGGDPEGKDFYVLAPVGVAPLAIATDALIDLLRVLLEKSGFDGTKVPPALGELRKNKAILDGIEERLTKIDANTDRVEANADRIKLLSEMKEMGLFREDLLEPGDAVAAKESHLATLLYAFDDLRKYYRSAYRKIVFGPEPSPNLVGGPLSYQFFKSCRLWHNHEPLRAEVDYREGREKVVIPDDQHPHEALAILEAQMRKMTELVGNTGERTVENNTFKALIRWEREDGVHASLTYAKIESW